MVTRDSHLQGAFLSHNNCTKDLITWIFVPFEMLYRSPFIICVRKNWAQVPPSRRNSGTKSVIRRFFEYSKSTKSMGNRPWFIVQGLFFCQKLHSRQSVCSTGGLEIFGQLGPQKLSEYFQRCPNISHTVRIFPTLSEYYFFVNKCYF